MPGQDVGYIRVSSVDQNLGRQLEGIGLDKVFQDKCSGGSRKRPGLAACLDHLREGDTLHVHSIDRLARNLTDLLELVTNLNQSGVSLRFHKEALSFTGDLNPMQQLQLSIMGAVAEFERAMIRERQREGIALAKAKGTRFGPPLKLDKDRVRRIRRLRSEGVSAAKIAGQLGISRSSVYSVLKRA